MKLFSQIDPLWKNEKLGNCSTTIGTSGCFVDCLGMASNNTPSAVNGMLKQKGGYANGCLVISSKAAEILGLKYSGKVYSDPNKICIAETDHYKNSGFPQHFFVYDKGMMVDPLVYPAKWQNNKYHIVSYRLFEFKELTIKEETMQKELQKAIEDITRDSYGDNFTDKEQKKAGEDLLKFKDEYKNFETKSMTKIDNLNGLATALEARVKLLEADKKDLVEVGERMEETINELEIHTKELTEKLNQKQEAIAPMDALALFIKALINKIK